MNSRTKDEERNCATFLAAKAAFNSGDLGHCMAFYAADHQLRSQAAPPGRIHIERYLASLMEHWPGVTVSVENVLTEGDWLSARSVATAVHSMTVTGIAPTFREIRTAFWEMHRFNAKGEIAESWNLIDAATIQTQLSELGGR